VFAHTGTLVSLFSFVLLTGNDLYLQDQGSRTFDLDHSAGDYLSGQWCSETNFLDPIPERLFAVSRVFFPADLLLGAWTSRKDLQGKVALQ